MWELETGVVESSGPGPVPIKGWDKGKKRQIRTLHIYIICLTRKGGTKTRMSVQKEERLKLQTHMRGTTPRQKNESDKKVGQEITQSLMASSWRDYSRIQKGVRRHR